MSVATSAVTLPADALADAAFKAIESTLFDIGFQSTKAEQAMEQGKARLDVLDANLFDIIKGVPYAGFMKMREVIITGSVDAGRSADAAQKQFERQIGRISSNCTVADENGAMVAYKKPTSESKDAVRKAQARAKEIARLDNFGESDLEDIKDGLLRKGDNKSLNEVKKINAEMTRRNADVIDAQKAEIKALTDKINARVKELAKSGTPDAVELLTQAAMILG